MSEITQFPGEYLTQEDRQKERWVIAFGALAIAGQDQDTQRIFLRSMLERFWDAPDKQPDPNDTQAYAKYTVKMLLRALLGDGKMREAATATLKQFVASMDDLPTKPPPA
jgi:hypothetical protein